MVFPGDGAGVPGGVCEGEIRTMECELGKGTGWAVRTVNRWWDWWAAAPLGIEEFWELDS